ncbi:MAG: hypothetical protein ACOYZ7_14355 [Chloroflexota bacterium]
MNTTDATDLAVTRTAITAARKSAGDSGPGLAATAPTSSRTAMVTRPRKTTSTGRAAWRPTWAAAETLPTQTQPAAVPAPALPTSLPRSTRTAIGSKARRSEQSGGPSPAAETRTAVILAPRLLKI